MFVPLAFSVGFAVTASYLLSSTFVPALAGRWLRGRGELCGRRDAWIETARNRMLVMLGGLQPRRWIVLAMYLVGCAGGSWLALATAGVDLFPTHDRGQFQVRLRAAPGTRVERTEVIANTARDVILQTVGADKVDVTLGFVGTQPPNFPINSIFLWTSGPQEAVLRIALRADAGVDLPALEETLRQRIGRTLPGVELTFEAGDVVGQVLSLGAATPIEVAVSGPKLAANRAFAERLRTRLSGLPLLRDVAFGQVLDYPTLGVNVDRERAAQLGLTVEQVGRSLAAATSSSRYIAPVYWRDPQSGVGYQVQLEIPQAAIRSAEDLENLVVAGGSSGNRRLGDVARVDFGRMPGEVDRYNQRRTITVTATLAPGVDLGHAVRAVDAAIRAEGEPPRGVNVTSRGQAPALTQTIDGLSVGLALAAGAILLAMAATFQSARVATVALSALPGTLFGTLIMLRLTGTTVNIQSYLGAITALGVCMANALLLVTFAEREWRQGASPVDAARVAVRQRLRPVLMTTAAMIAGMLPMTLGLGAAGGETAPLARAVIGGLIGSTPSVLFVVPLAFSAWRGVMARRDASLHPDDLPVTAR